MTPIVVICDSTSYITEIVTPLRGSTTIAYTSSSEGKAVSMITDAQGNKRSYGGTQSSSQMRIIDSRGNGTLYTNNYFGYTASITTASGNKVNFEYDNLHYFRGHITYIVGIIISLNYNLTYGKTSKGDTHKYYTRRINFREK